MKEYSKAPDVLTMQEVADLLGVDKITIWRYIKRGKIKTIHLFGSVKLVRILKKDIAYLFDSKRKEKSK